MAINIYVKELVMVSLVTYIFPFQIFIVDFTSLHWPEHSKETLLDDHLL